VGRGLESTEGEDLMKTIDRCINWVLDSLFGKEFRRYWYG
jgi:hypothetical protein